MFLLRHYRLIVGYQREYLERCEDRKSYNYLASHPFVATSGQLIPVTQA